MEQTKKKTQEITMKSSHSDTTTIPPLDGLMEREREKERERGREREREKRGGG